MSKLEELTRPIIGIENRTAKEVFGIMCDRFTSALAAMPASAPAVKVKIPDIGIELYEHYSVMSAQTHEALVKEYARGVAKDIAAENERLRAALEFVQQWAWRDDPPNAAQNLSDKERLSAIKYHPSILPGRAALERKP